MTEVKINTPALAKAGEKETKFNSLLGWHAILFALFVFAYELFSIKRYSEEVKGQEGSGGEVFGTVFVFLGVYTVVAACLLVLGVLMLVFTNRMKKSEQRKKGFFIAAFVVKCIVCIGTTVWLLLAFNMPHTDVLSKIFYTLSALAWWALTVRTVVLWKKFWIYNWTQNEVISNSEN